MENISKGVRSKTQYIFAVLKLIPVGMEFHTSEILGFVNMALEKEGKGEILYRLYAYKDHERYSSLRCENI